MVWWIFGGWMDLCHNKKIVVCWLCLMILSCPLSIIRSNQNSTFTPNKKEIFLFQYSCPLWKYGDGSEFIASDYPSASILVTKDDWEGATKRRVEISSHSHHFPSTACLCTWIRIMDMLIESKLHGQTHNVIGIIHRPFSVLVGLHHVEVPNKFEAG